MYSLYLYFLGLSLRNTYKELIIFKDEKEFMYRYGTGYRNLSYTRSAKVKEYFFYIRWTVIDQVSSKLSGYGFV